MNFRSRKLLDLARDQPCANCGCEDGTTVAAHSNMSFHGKGMSIKAHDCFHAHLCLRCHAWLDQGTGRDPTGIYFDREKPLMFQRAMDTTTLRLWKSGKIKVAK